MTQLWWFYSVSSLALFPTVSIFMYVLVLFYAIYLLLYRSNILVYSSLFYIYWLSSFFIISRFMLRFDPQHYPACLFHTDNVQTNFLLIPTSSAGFLLNARTMIDSLSSRSQPCPLFFPSCYNAPIRSFSFLFVFIFLNVNIWYFPFQTSPRGFYYWPVFCSTWWRQGRPSVGRCRSCWGIRMTNQRRKKTLLGKFCNKNSNNTGR